MKLAKIEEQCLEKDLILEQVQRLTDRITNKVDSSKDDTLNLAKKVNYKQSQIKDKTKKMMATVSELSIAQANALSFPSEEIEREWSRMIEAEERLRDKSKHQLIVII